MLALQFIVFMAVILIVSIGLHRLPLATSSRTKTRVRVVLLARVRVPAQQLDPARVRVLRPVRDDVPDDLRGARRLARLGRHPEFFNKWMTPFGLVAAVPRRRGAAARVAQDHARAAVAPVHDPARRDGGRRSSLLADRRSRRPRRGRAIFADAARAADLARQLRPRRVRRSARSARSSVRGAAVRRSRPARIRSRR